MKPQILLLHGALNDQKQFDALKPMLEDSFEVRTMDFEGHGQRISSNRPFRAEYHIENILEYASENLNAPLNLFGYSMGGYAALLFASRNPSKVAKVFTHATKIKWDSEIAARECMMLSPEKMKEKIPAFAKMLEEKHTALGWEKLVMGTSSLLSDLGTNNYLGAKTLQAITCPVHVSVGDRDQTVTMEEYLEACQLIKVSELGILQNTPHPFERVDLSILAEAIKKFWGA